MPLMPDTKIWNEVLVLYSWCLYSCKLLITHNNCRCGGASSQGPWHTSKKGLHSTNLPISEKLGVLRTCPVEPLSCPGWAVNVFPLSAGASFAKCYINWRLWWQIGKPSNLRIGKIWQNLGVPVTLRNMNVIGQQQQLSWWWFSWRRRRRRWWIHCINQAESTQPLRCWNIRIKALL